MDRNLLQQHVVREGDGSHACPRRGAAPVRRYRLVIPAIIHDGKELPQSLTFIQSMDIKSCYNPRMREDSEKAEEPQ
jgi:hypothetical protein